MKRFTLITATIIPMLGFVGAQCTTPEGPSGAHLRTGTPECQCNPDGSVTCTSFKLCGVGNSNANVVLQGSYSATVDCQNNGGNIVPVKAQGVLASSELRNLQPRNGCLTVPELELSTTTPPAPTPSQFEAEAECPNGNWTPMLRTGTITLDSFTYTLTFAGFSCPYITFADTCPA